MDLGIYGGPGTNPSGKLGDNLSFGVVESYTHIFNCAGVGTLSPTFFKGLNYVIGNSWFTYFEKDKSMGANQNLLIVFPVFLVIFLFELKSHADNDFMMKMIIF